jgi:tetratricopeptide (TPR) repeat protein
MLLTLAVKAVQESGGSGSILAEMPSPYDDEAAIDALSRVIESEPDFVDAFLSLPLGKVEKEIFGLLAATLHRALQRQPEHADLYYHCGRVLERLGRSADAIAATEQAVRLDPKFIDALIHLATLYHKTDRLDDAMTRLERTIELGAEYPDVYLLLGHLHRDTGRLDRARWAYRKALGINKQYTAARDALDALTKATPAKAHEGP